MGFHICNVGYLFGIPVLLLWEDHLMIRFLLSSTLYTASRKVCDGCCKQSLIITPEITHYGEMGRNSKERSPLHRCSGGKCRIENNVVPPARFFFGKWVRFKTTFGPPLFLGGDSEGLQHSFGWKKGQFLENMSLWGNTDQIRTCPLSTFCCHDSINLIIHFFFRFLFFMSLIVDGPQRYHPATLWSLRTFPSLPGSRLTYFYRDASSTFCFDKNRTHDVRTSRCAGYLVDHSGDERCGVNYWQRRVQDAVTPFQIF